MESRWCWRLLCVLACSSPALAACGGDEERAPAPPADRAEVELFPSTIELHDADLRSLEELGDDGRLTFSEPPGALDDVAPGRVLVATKTEKTPAGLLRLVRSARVEDGKLVLDTVHAPIQLAFRKVDLQLARRNTGPLGEESWPGPRLLDLGSIRRSAGASRSLELIVFDGDADVETTNDQIRIDGELAGAIDFELSLGFDWGAITDLPDLVTDCFAGLLEGEVSCDPTDLLPEATARLDVTPSLASQIELQGAAVLAFDESIDLFQQTLGALVFGPIVITPHVKVLASVSGEASARFESSVNAAVYFDTSVTLSSKRPSTPSYRPPELRDVVFDAEPPEVTLKAKARAALGAELSLLLYGVTGPYLRAEAFGEVDADVFRDPCVELHAGLEGAVGVKITVPPFLYPFELFDWEATFTPVDETLDVPVPPCVPPPKASMLPPGAGPDAERLANPEFEPWSRTVSSVFDDIGIGPGGITRYVDQQRSIDERVVVGGRGAQALVKLDESGELVWGRELNGEALGGVQALRPARTIPARDTGMLVLAEGTFPPLQLVKLSQAGNLRWSRSLELPDETCGVRPVGLARDAGSGFYAVVACDNTERVYVAHLDADANLLSAFSFADESAVALEPSLAVSAAGELFVGGRMTHDLDSMFAVRVDAAGEIAFSKRYVACEEAWDVYPSQAIIEENGDVTVAGRGGAEHNGFLARLRRDGGVGFAAFPGFGFGAGSVFVLDSIAQLSTTGYVASGSTVRFTADELSATPGLALLQLDAVGRPVWSRRYTLLDADGDPLAASHTDLHLTDDGGIFVSGIAKQDSDAFAGDLWAMKVFAKDGELDFDPSAAIATPLDADPDDSIVDLPCTLSDEDWEPSFREEPELVTTASSVELSPWTADVHTQTE